MAVAASPPRPRQPTTHTLVPTARRFFRSPKGAMLAVLLVLAALAAPAAGVRPAAAAVLEAVVAAALLDVVIVRIVDGRWAFPSSGILSGLFVALVLSPTEPLSIRVAATALAVGSKYVLRGSRWPIFNPAAFGLLMVAALFGSGESWWGSLPDLPAVLVVALLLTGAFITDKVNKFPLALAFFAAFYGLFTVLSFGGGSFVGDPALVTAAFRPPYLQMTLFFTCFMLTDPPTSPARYGEQVLYGFLVAAASVAVQVWFHPQYFLLAGLLLGNLGLFWRRRTAVARPGVLAQSR